MADKVVITAPLRQIEDRLQWVTKDVIQAKIAQGGCVLLEENMPNDEDEFVTSIEEINAGIIFRYRGDMLPLD